MDEAIRLVKKLETLYPGVYKGKETQIQLAEMTKQLLDKVM